MIPKPKNETQIHNCTKMTPVGDIQRDYMFSLFSLSPTHFRLHIYISIKTSRISY
jgi:hypothetical protein